MHTRKPPAAKSGHKPFGALIAPLPAARKTGIADKSAALQTALTLYELRHVRAVSQAELARRLAVGQPAVAKLERRTDMYVSNLRRYVEALGGTLEITARFPDGEVRLTEVGQTVDGTGSGKRAPAP